MTTNRFRFAAAGIAATLLLASTQLATAATCFTGFSGTVNYQFTAATSKFTTLGTRSLAGTVFGALSSCAGLSQWPLLATEIVTPTGITLAFRAMTVDASGCGATDNIAALSPVTLSGTMQLHNDRNNFSNSTTLVFSACATPPAARSARMAATVRDAAGNE